MGKKSFSDVERQIKDLVQNAVGSMDFSNLNQKIQGTVDSALNEVNKGLDKVHANFASGTNPNENKNVQMNYNYSPGSNRRFGKVRGTVGGFFSRFFGVIGILGFGTPAVIGCAMLLAGHAISIPAAAIFTPLAIASACVAGRGFRVSGVQKRFRCYVQRIGNRNMCALNDLADSIGKSVRYVREDVNRMIQSGLFMQGHLDDAGECLILDHETYRLYQRSKEQVRLAREQKEKEPVVKMDTELKAVIEAGNLYVKQIRQVNDELPEPIISEKLYRLEQLITKIYTQLQLNPKKLPDMKRFTDYYLPTTIKLVTTYRQFEAEPIQTENIQKSKGEIIETLDTINEAFENLLDSLYDEISLDISTDISVLQTMLAQEGLTISEFEKMQASQRAQNGE